MGYFLIDGYNLLFHWSDETLSLQVRREHLVAWIQQVFQQTNLRGTIVFDGAHRIDEEYGLAYPSPMEVAFTPKGQTADQYILDLIHLNPNKKLLTIVTNDLMLKRHAAASHVKTLSNRAFLEWLMKKKTKKRGKKQNFQESHSQVERLIKIFEERLKTDES